MTKKLFYDPTNASTLAASDFAGAHLYASNTRLTRTTVGSREALDVYISNPITVDIDGVYNLTTNASPDSVGTIFHTRGAALTNVQQIERTTAGVSNADALVAANIKGQDVNGFNYIYNGATWDRLQGTAGAINIHDGGNSITVDFTSDPALANASIDNESKAVTAVATKVVTTDLPNRKHLFLYNNGSSICFLGKQTGLGIANGFPMFPGVYIEMRIGAAVGLYGICDAALTTDIRNLQVA